MTIRIDPVVLKAVEEVAVMDGVDPQAWVNDVLARAAKQSRDWAYWRERGKRGDLKAALAILDRAGTDEPEPEVRW